MSIATYAVTGSTATITLDSPKNRNAITQALLDGISDGLSQATADDTVRSIVLTHTGTVFCAGADLKETSGGDSGSSSQSDQRSRGQAANAVIREILTCPKPVIGAISGHVRAGGMGFTAACDMVVAGPKATFGLSEVRIGVVAALIAPVVLARLDDRTAMDWFLRARIVSPAEAKDAGFITQALAAEGSSVEEAVEEILADLRKAAPRALAASKNIVNRDVLESMDRHESDMIELSSQFFSADDAKAGMQSFIEKTTPPWVLSE